MNQHRGIRLKLNEYSRQEKQGERTGLGWMLGFAIWILNLCSLRWHFMCPAFYQINVKFVRKLVQNVESNDRRFKSYHNLKWFLFLMSSLFFIFFLNDHKIFKFLNLTTFLINHKTRQKTLLLKWFSNFLFAKTRKNLIFYATFMPSETNDGQT